MSKAKDLASYNIDYFRLLDVVLDQQKPVKITIPYGQAVHMRQDFYRWRRLLQKEGDIDNHRRAGAIVVQLSPKQEGVETINLCFTRHDMTEIGSILSAALDELEIDLGDIL